MLGWRMRETSEVILKNGIPMNKKSYIVWTLAEKPKSNG
jgi:hypothetical protein